VKLPRTLPSLPLGLTLIELVMVASVLMVLFGHP
jgi:hypothetical protein